MPPVAQRIISRVWTRSLGSPFSVRSRVGITHRSSDIDMLVITRSETRRARLVRRLPATVRHDRLALVCFNLDRWNEEVRRSTLFLHHIRLEGEILFDPAGLVAGGFAE
jgi:hypothetical protein